MALKDFTWFDRPASESYSPSNMENYVGGTEQLQPSFVPRQRGGLSTLGAALSGIGAAFAGDTQWLQRQNEQYLREQQADQEFYTALQRQRMERERARDTGVYAFNPLTGEVTLQAAVPKGGIVRNITTPEQKVELQQQLEQAKGIPTADYGRFELSKESIKNLDDVDKILFPKGDLESFRRDVAGLSNLPVVGGPAPFNKEAQNVYRKLGSSLAARQLIQTGVAANESERRQLANQFLANFGSDPAAFREGLGQLKTFYKGYQDLYKTKGIQKKGDAKELNKDNLFEGL